MEFTQSTKNDYDKVMKCLSEAQALQGITNEKVDAQGEGIRQLMVQMQQVGDDSLDSMILKLNCMIAAK